MMTTLVTSPLIERARSASQPRTGVVSSRHAVEAVSACAPMHATVPATFSTTTTTDDMNLWLGGDVQVKGFGSDYATKRITPGRLEGMT
jgi:hypothetical protein